MVNHIEDLKTSLGILVKKALNSTQSSLKQMECSISKSLAIFLCQRIDKDLLFLG